MAENAAQISFEFFPPNTPRGQESLLRTSERLGAFAPSYYSVTYGAGGTTRDRTTATVESLISNGFNAAPHLSWGGDTEDEVLSLIERYRDLGVDRIVALRGDTPSGFGAATHIRHATELVDLIRRHFGDTFDIEVAAYPEVHPDAPSPAMDIEYLKLKIDAGATSCITQYFYNPDSYFYFVDRCRAAGVTSAIVPGVMPITDFERLVRFSDKAGADVPRWIAKSLEAYAEDKRALSAFGVDVVTALCERLLQGGAPGIHFYTLNKAAATEKIARNLGLG